jgi:protoporphyrinogen/coproporphyrinogen III oxidase
VRPGAPVRALEQTTSGFRLTLGPVPAEQYVETRTVVLAAPATPTSRLLHDIAPAAAAEVAAIEYASVAIVTLGYADVGRPLDGSGFLVPAVEGHTTKAVTFLTTKWAHLDGASTLLRASVGRYGEQQDIQRDDAELVDVVHADLVSMLGLPTRPVLSRVTRWGGGLPQYAPGHLDRVRRIRAALPAGVVVCGAAYDGVGIPACIASGQEAAAVLREWLRERRTDEAEGA